MIVTKMEFAIMVLVNASKITLVLIALVFVKIMIFLDFYYFHQKII